MAASRRASLRAGLLAGLLYLLIGRFFPQPANNLEAWRLAAWGASAVVYAVHIWYEHFRLRNAPRVTATHVAAGVALGGFTLALAGMMRSLWMTSGIRPTWLLALVVWPAVTAVPAFVGAFVAATALWRFRPYKV
jgi:hypothetical protein